MRNHQHPLLAPLLLLAAATAQTHDQTAGKPALKVDDATQLTRTKVTAHLQHRLDPDVNLLWCATMQLTWDELGSVFGTPPKLAEPSEIGDGLAARLVGKDDLDPAAYVARAGFGRDRIVEKIKADLQRVFGDAASPNLLPNPADLDPKDILAYGYLWKHLPFALPFRTGEQPFRFGQREVQSFGLWSKWGDRDEPERLRQLQIHRYEGPTEWVVELRTKGKKDRLLVARGKPGPTLAATIAGVMGLAAAARPKELEAADRFEMPKLDFDVTRRFGELAGKRFANEGYQDQVIRDAIQNIRFKLDENGAILKSEAVVGVTGMDTPATPRRLLADGPFLVLLAQQGRSMPYFALWVGNDELLLPARKRDR